MSATSAADPQLDDQGSALDADPDGVADRDITVIRIVGDQADGGFDATAVRERLSMPPDRFELVLLGMDGGVALRQHHPVALHDLFARIDAMPMRREQLRKRADTGCD